MRRIFNDNERGATAVMVAGAMLFLFGAAALAVDTSIFYGDARTDQNTADFACLAGVVEDDSDEKVAMAAAFVRQNWPAMELAAFDPAAQTLELDNNRVEFETGIDGDENKMRVQVLETADTNFARALGAGAVSIAQEAVCEAQIASASSVVPFGALPSWDGILQTDSPCDTGNCRALDVPRDDVTGGNPSGKTFIRNIALGAQPTLVPYKGALTEGGPHPSGVYDCAPGVPECSVLDQNQGVSAGQFSDGLVRESTSAAVTGRLRDISADTAPPLSLKGGRLIDDDGLTEILGNGWSSALPASAPPTWDTDVHTAFNATTWSNATNVYWDAPIAKCTSPRFVKVPIIAQLDWIPGDDVDPPPGNKDPVKIIGFYDAIIVDPNDAGDFNNSVTVKTASTAIIWPGPNATCTDLGGAPFVAGGQSSTRSVKLVAP